MATSFNIMAIVRSDVGKSYLKCSCMRNIQARPRESIPEFEVALRLKPQLKGAADNLQRAQAQLGSQR